MSSSDRPKAKPASKRVTNDARKNGKAFKKGKRRGAKSNPQTELSNALMGKGAMVRIMRPIPGSEPDKRRFTEAAGV